MSLIMTLREMNDMYTMVVFDLDGTVCDTLKDLAFSVNHALKIYGLDTFPVEEYRYFVGNGMDRLIGNVLGDKKDDRDLFDKVKKAFMDYYAEHLLDFTGEYPGLKSLFKELERHNIIFGIISNKPDRFVPVIINDVYKDIRFSFLSGKKDDLPGKPDPVSLCRYMDMYDINREKVLYVGDSNVDVVFGHNAGVKVCGVTWGFRTEHELSDSGADFIAHNSEQLKKVIFSDG